VKKPERFAARDRSANIHLGRPAWRSNDDFIRETARDRRTSVGTSAIDNNYFQPSIKSPNPEEEIAEQASFVQNGNDYGDRWRSRVQWHNNTTSSVTFPAVSKLSNRETE
jgi:hypothetical protein